MKMQAMISGEGAPLVLVPGGLTGWLSWKPHAEILSRSRTVIRVQLLCVQCGVENRPLPQGYSVLTESEALGATLESLGHTAPMDVAAWSFGAFTALQYALDHPQAIRTLTLIEPPAMWVLDSGGPPDAATQEVAAFFLGLGKDDITEEDLEEFAGHVGFIPKGEFPRTHPQWPRWLTFRQSLRSAPTVVTHKDDVGRLQQFRAPVLLVKGSNSTRFLHQIIDRLHENLPQSRVVELAGGHAPHIQSMNPFLQELEVFLGSH